MPGNLFSKEIDLRSANVPIQYFLPFAVAFVCGFFTDNTMHIMCFHLDDVSIECNLTVARMEY